ncbi:hypothetical protein [Mycobacterium paraense]|uniref:hypothetical protein n=1 Tax=Mycobacterium paraense TaxID=767916 RepID=UPI00111C4524|nr:hypothetical protein [Mycobacterium paraense]
MGEFTRVFNIDPSGARSAAPGAAFGEWNPPADLVSEAPADQPFDHGEKPGFGPIPENIVTRSFDFDDDSCDFDGDEDTIGDDGDEFEPDDLDGDDVAQDGDFSDDDDAADPDGDVADNIVRAHSMDALRQAGGLVPGPMSRSRL